MLEFYHHLRAEDPWAFQWWFFGLGACVGSFLNVCILRLPAGQSIVRPGSHCACGAPIKWYDNIPILSWFILRGRARCCGRRFSIRYALLEAATAGAFLWLWNTQRAGVAVPGMVFFSLLLLGAMIDLDHMELPDVSTIGGMFAGFVLSCIFPQMHVAGYESSGVELLDGLRGGVLSGTGILVGTGVVFWIRELGEFFLKKEAMGYGDVLLMGCIGAFCGWQGALFAIFGGAVLGCLVILPWMALAKLMGKGAEGTAAAAGAKGAGGAKGTDATQGVEGAKATEGKAPAEQAAATAIPAPEAGSPEAAAPAPAFGVEIPFGPWLALGGFLYYAGLHPWVDEYLEQVRAMVFNPPWLG